MNEKRLKTIKIVTCSICALMYVAGLVMFFLKNLSLSFFEKTISALRQ